MRPEVCLLCHCLCPLLYEVFTLWCSHHHHPFAELFPSHRMEILTNSSFTLTLFYFPFLWIQPLQEPHVNGTIFVTAPQVHPCYILCQNPWQLPWDRVSLKTGHYPMREFWFCVSSHLLMGTWFFHLMLGWKLMPYIKGTYKYPFRSCFLFL